MLPDDKLGQVVRDQFDLSPAGIIEELDLRRPIYSPTAVYGHFGRSGPGFPWEEVTHAESLAACKPRRKRSGKKGGKS